MKRVNPYSLVPNNNQIVIKTSPDKTSPGSFSSIVTGTISISKTIFDNYYLNFPLPYHPDIWKVIFFKLNFKELQKCSLVSKECYKLANDPIFSKEVIFNEFCFNPNHWNKFYGMSTVSNEEIDKAFKLLPNNINEILKSPCPAFPNKRIMDTHVLTWIPETINGKTVTINSFIELLKQQAESSESKIDIVIWDRIIQQEGSKQLKSGWVLMTKDIIPGSRDKSYFRQIELITELNGNGQTNYRVPKTDEVIVCIMADYLKSKKRSFSSDPWTYTYCQEYINNHQVLVGGFTTSGFIVCCSRDCSNVGVAALWEL